LPIRRNPTPNRGYDGGYDAVRRYAGRWSKERGHSTAAAYVPLILAGLTETKRGVRLLARDLHLAVDGVDYVPGKRGYRMLKSQFISERIVTCRDERLVYLAIHNHGGRDSVGFSSDDNRSHERGYCKRGQSSSLFDGRVGTE
jgi:hypothetical protein